MNYARYFCGEYDGTVISEEEYQELSKNETNIFDTVDYAPIFDGQIYSTLSESATAQIKKFGCLYDDDRRKQQ